MSERQDAKGNRHLHDAARSNDARLIHQLIGDGEDPNIQNNEGQTPLDIALLHDNDEAIIVLVQHGAK